MQPPISTAMLQILEHAVPFMKILEIDVFHYLRGGAETVYFRTIDGLERRGHEVINFALKWDLNLKSEYSDFFAESKESRKGFLRHFKNLYAYFYNIDAARKLQKLIAENRPDIAHVHLMWGQHSPSILNVLKKSGVPVVLTAHDYRLVCPAYTFRNGKGAVCEECKGSNFVACVRNKCCKGNLPLSVVMATEQYFRNAYFPPHEYLDGIIYVSEFSRRKHEQYYTRLKELPNMVLYNISGDEEAIECGEKSDYVLFAGRLSEEKGVKTLIRAMRYCPEVILKMAGRGPLEQELRQYVEENGLKNVEFLGFKDRDELNSLISGSRFVIVPSECYENNPMSIVEAYALGIPVVASRLGGIPEIVIPESTGFLFEAFDEKDLASTLSRAMRLDDAGLRNMKKKALEFAHENFNNSLYFERLENFFNDILTARNGAGQRGYKSVGR